MKTVFMKKKMLLAGVMAAALVGCGQVAEEAQIPEQQASSDMTSEETPDIGNTETEDSVSEAESDELLTSVYASAKVGNTLTFGTYEQDNDLSNGQEPIQWEVIAVESDSIEVISSYILDVYKYGSSDGDGWANCKLRSWLNDDFLNTAFTEEEQDCIKVTTVESPGYNLNEATQDYWMNDSIDDGGSTEDKIFVPALGNDIPWQCEPTDAAITAANEKGSVGGDDYWLRNPVIPTYSSGKEGSIAHCAAGGFDDDGFVWIKGQGNYYGVRPVMWLRIK